MTLSSRRSHRSTAMIIIASFLCAAPTAYAAQNGYCWNDKVGWVNMSGVTFSDSTRTFGGSATYFDGTFNGATSGPGEIDFGAQGNLSVTLSASTDTNGNYPLIGQAFSEQLGWIVANHGGTEPAAMKTSGELTGNFWSNEFGWFNCSSSDVGASNVQIWNPGNATSSPSPAASQNPVGGGGGAGGRRGTGGLPVERMTSSTPGGSTGGLSSSLPGNGGANPQIFRDVPVSAWFAGYIAELVNDSIVSGYHDAHGEATGLFGPGNPVTGAEILKMAILASGKTIGEGPPQNVSAQNDWSAPYVKEAEILHLSVYVAALDVHHPATRGQVIQTVLEAFGVSIAPGTNPFGDLPSGSTFAPAIETAYRLGLITGDTDAQGHTVGTVRPDAPINRAEAAKIVVLARKGLKK